MRCLLFFLSLLFILKTKKKQNIGRASHFYQHIDTLYAKKRVIFFNIRNQRVEGKIERGTMVERILEENLSDANSSKFIDISR